MRAYKRTPMQTVQAMRDSASYENIICAYVICAAYISLLNIYNLKVPSAIEVTYLNKKLIDTYSPINEIPNKLDNKNVIKNQEIKLPIYWYKK